MPKEKITLFRTWNLSETRQTQRSVNQRLHAQQFAVPCYEIGKTTEDDIVAAGTTLRTKAMIADRQCRPTNL